MSKLHVRRSGEMSSGDGNTVESSLVDSGVMTQAPRDLLFVCLIDESVGLRRMCGLCGQMFHRPAGEGTPGCGCRKHGCGCRNLREEQTA
jgi:hypothetical protein